MPLGECENRHRYNRNTHGDTCPICGLVSRKYKDEGKTLEELKALYELKENQYACGILVCVEGINKGRLYPIHPGKNLIGSGDRMDVQILGDPEVDLYAQAVLVFDNRTQDAMLLPGEARGMVYLNDKALYERKQLFPYAAIELGQTKLLFLPFCSENFNWQEGVTKSDLYGEGAAINGSNGEDEHGDENY